MNFKQIFCDHIWQDTEAKSLRTQRDVYIPAFGHNPTTYSDFEYVAIYQKCVKCQKERVIEKRYMIL